MMKGKRTGMALMVSVPLSLGAAIGGSFILTAPALAVTCAGAGHVLGGHMDCGGGGGGGFYANPPTGLTHVVTGTTVTETWQAGSGDVKYGVQITGQSAQTTPGTSYTFTNLSPDTRYIVTVYGIASDSAQSAPVYDTVQTSAVAPQSPTDLMVTPTETTVSASWTGSSVDTSYTVQINGQTPVVTTGTNYLFTGLQPDTTYTVTVFGSNGSGGSSAVDTIVQTSPTVTGFSAPTVSSNNTTATATTLTWDAIPGATTYTISENGTVIDTITPDSSTGQLATTDTFNNLSSATSYSFVVTAKDAGQYALSSQPLSVTTLTSLDGGLPGQLPEVPATGALPVLGLAGVGALWAAKRRK